MFHRRARAVSVASMFRWIVGREGPGGARQIEVGGDARARSTLPSVDYADAFSADVDVQRATAEAWARTMLTGGSAASRTALVAGWSSLGLRLGRGPGTVLGWRILERTPDLLLLGAASRVGPGFSAQLLVERREHDLRFCTFVQFHSSAARLLWAGVQPMHVRVVRELLEDARTRSAGDR